MDRASISTFGGATSVASSANQAYGGDKGGGAQQEQHSQGAQQSYGMQQSHGMQQSQGTQQSYQSQQSNQQRSPYQGQGQNQGQAQSQGHGQAYGHQQSGQGNQGSSGVSLGGVAHEMISQQGSSQQQQQRSNEPVQPASQQMMRSQSQMSASGGRNTGAGRNVDPIATAADFTSDTAEIVFLSSATGNGANRQPVTRFRIHEVNLNVHSPVLSELVDDEEGGGGEITLEEDAATLKLLFALMYNRPTPTLTMSDWQTCLRLARCSQKYDCARAKEVAAAYFTEQEQTGTISPFMSYAIACQYGLHALEEQAAERSTKYDLNTLPEIVFALMQYKNFQRLSSFHARRQEYYADVLDNINLDTKELEDTCYQTGGICAVAPWQRLKKSLAWPRTSKSRDGNRRPLEAKDVLGRLIVEIGAIDCGSCAKALCHCALQAQTALTSLPAYREEEEASF